MSPRPVLGPRVVVQDVGVDAALVEDDGRATLMLRPAQTFRSAVSAVQRVMPGMHPDAVRRLVRENLPFLPDLTEEPAPGGIATPTRTQPHGLPWRLIALLALVGCLVLTSVYVVGRTRAQPAPTQLLGAPISNPVNTRLLRIWHMTCRHPVNVSIAECVHVDDKGVRYPQTEVITSTPEAVFYSTVVDGSRNHRIVFVHGGDGVLEQTLLTQYRAAGFTVLVGRDWMYVAQKAAHVTYAEAYLRRAHEPYERFDGERSSVKWDGTGKGP